MAGSSTNAEEIALPGSILRAGIADEVLFVGYSTDEALCVHGGFSNGWFMSVSAFSTANKLKSVSPMCCLVIRYSDTDEAMMKALKLCRHTPSVKSVVVVLANKDASSAIKANIHQKCNAVFEDCKEFVYKAGDGKLRTDTDIYMQTLINGLRAQATCTAASFLRATLHFRAHQSPLEMMGRQNGTRRLLTPLVGPSKNSLKKMKRT
jgi:hypothetical protein